ncbi:hypothetical protein [Haladaptatus salinisoli]|uniref:hypothetical protein n=1 Tax=Haladaptatus salinisoli TaxID=2884876 RepID=UPI001D0AB37A|nr:hypothetical protein [Haladaptatus salinisoli]
MAPLSTSVTRPPGPPYRSATSPTSAPPANATTANPHAHARARKSHVVDGEPGDEERRQEEARLRDGRRYRGYRERQRGDERVDEQGENADRFDVFGVNRRR